jgi:RNA polymerase sigma factor (sigma-70 family)
MTKSKREYLTAADERDLAVRYRSGDIGARDRLIESQIAYVYQLSKRFNFLGMTHEDIAHEGLIGLMRAVEKFDPDCGVRLVTYAHNWIVSFMYRARSRKSSLVRYPEHLQDGRGGRPKLSPPVMFSLDAKLSSFDGVRGHDYHEIADRCDSVSEIDDADQDHMEMSNLKIAMRALTPAEKLLIEEQFGLGGIPTVSLSRQSKDHHHTPRTIRRMRDEALGKLREVMGA